MTSTTTALAPPTNPYLPLQHLLYSSLYLRPAQPAYNRQSYALTTIIALLAFCVVAALIIRWWKGNFWVVRLHRTNWGVFVGPNAVVSWLGFSGVYLVVPLWLGGWCVAWATFLSPILSRPTPRSRNQATPSPSFSQSTSQYTQSAPSRFAAYHPVFHPTLVNIFFLIVPIIMLATMLPLVVILNEHFNDSFSQAFDLNNKLSNASLRFESGDFNVAEWQAFKVPLEGLGGELAGLYKEWRNVWVGWSCFVGFVSIIFLISITLHFASIHRSLLLLRASKGNNSSSENVQFKGLRSAYLSLIFTTTLTGLIAFSYFIILAILASKATEVANNGRLSEIVGLASVYVFVVFGGISSIVLLVRSFTTNAPATTTSTTSSQTQSHSHSQSQSLTSPISPLKSARLPFGRGSTGSEMIVIKMQENGKGFNGGGGKKSFSKLDDEDLECSSHSQREIAFEVSRDPKGGNGRNSKWEEFERELKRERREEQDRREEEELRKKMAHSKKKVDAWI